MDAVSLHESYAGKRMTRNPEQTYFNWTAVTFDIQQSARVALPESRNDTLTQA